jgi:hypothetical protein
MSVGLSEIRSAIKATLADSALELEALDVMPTAVHSPTVAVLPKSWMYNETFDGDCSWELEIWLYVLIADDLEQAQRSFDAYMAPEGDSSIAAALQTDPSLGLSGVNLSVTGANQYAQLVQMGGAECLGGYLRAVVLT